MRDFASFRYWRPQMHNEAALETEAGPNRATIKPNSRKPAEREIVNVTHSFLSRFSSGLEQQFQKDYYARIRTTMRLVSPLMVTLILVHLRIDVRSPRPYDLAVNVPQLFFWSLIFVLTWVKSFERVWQLLVVPMGWLAAILVLGQLAPLLTSELAKGTGAGAELPTIPQQKFYFVIQFAVLVVSLATLRLQARWAALLYAGVSSIRRVGFPFAPASGSRYFPGCAI